MSNQNQQSQPPLASSTRLLPWVNDLVEELKLDTFGLVDIQVSESAPTSVTYVGNDPVESYRPVMLRQTIKLTVIFNPSKMPPQSSALNDSLTHWLHTMVYLRGGGCGSTVILPDQSQWAVQSYSIDMDATQIPRIHLELVGMIPVPIPGIEEWIPTKLNWPVVETRDQILKALTAMVDRDLATLAEAAAFEVMNTLSPDLKKRVDAYILACKQGREPKKKIERKDAFWKD